MYMELIKEAVNKYRLDCEIDYNADGARVRLTNPRTKRSATVNIPKEGTKEAVTNWLHAAVLDIAERTSNAACRNGISIDVTVDTYEMERLVFGGMLYDCLTYKNVGGGTQINLNSAIKCNGGVVQIHGEKLLEIMRLANKPSKMFSLEIV